MTNSFEWREKMPWRIVAPHYVAGLIVSGGRVVQAAPILNWALGKQWNEVRRYLKKKGYRGEPMKGKRNA